MWKMLQRERPDNYVVGTGVAPTIQEFVEEAFEYADLDWREHVEIDPRYFRPTEVDYLLADASKAQKELDWNPKVTYKQLIPIMVDADMEAVGEDPIGDGIQILNENFSEWHRWETSVTAVLNSARNGIE